ncbi:hypothetical protein NF212_01770 [Parasalinivibrio latis]|uniref:DUF6701 domain-containing protein n=1 Tax=Parasalinivibrio latis TaxID=2952610 RepID=UPI0030DEC4BF
MKKRFGVVFVLMSIFLGGYSFANDLPLCVDVFPPGDEDNVPDGVEMKPPKDIEDELDSISNSFCPESKVYPPGDYVFGNCTLAGLENISGSGVTTRFFFKELRISGNVNLNSGPNDKPENMFIYVKGPLEFTGNLNFKGVVYAAGKTTVSGNSTINGAFAVENNSDLITSGNSKWVYDEDAVNNADLSGMCNSKPQPQKLDHFRIKYTQTPLTCSPLKINVFACKNSECTDRFTDEEVTATLNAENITGGWSKNPVTLKDGTAKAYLKQFKSGIPIVLDVVGSSHATNPESKTLCSRGGPYSEDYCTLRFNDAGFIFDIPDKLAGKPASDIKISAVVNSSPGRAEGQCIPYLSQPRNVGFKFSYQIPDSKQIIGAPKPVVNNVVLDSDYKNVRINFNEQGIGYLDVNYPDAGKIRIDAKHAGTDNYEGLEISGFDTFVSFPAGLCVEPEQICTKGNARCPVFKKTGQPFDITVKGVAWQQNPPSSGDFCDYSTATPNYAHEGLAITSNLKTPASGVNAIVEGCRQVNGGTVCDQPATFTGWQKGNDNTRQFNVSEVGVFTFTAEPPDEYLGSPGVVIDGKMQPVQPATSKPVGRFIPDHFVLNNGDITPGCHVFSYMAEPFSISGDLVAQNHKGATTQNYRGNFAKASAGVVAENDNDGRNLSVRLDSHLGTQSTTSQSIETNWRAGVAAIEDQIVFSRGTVLDGPYDNMDIGISLSDPDGSELTGKNMHPGQAGECGANCTAVELGTQMMRYGRGHVEYAVGPLNETVKSNVEARYWNGSDWVRNDLDNCSVLGNVSLTASGTHIVPSPVPAGVSRSWPDSHFNDGRTTLHWLSNQGFEGEVTASVPMPAWLKYYWNWDGSSPNANVDPRASVYFGIFRGHDRVVFWREVN